MKRESVSGIRHFTTLPALDRQFLPKETDTFVQDPLILRQPLSRREAPISCDSPGLVPKRSSSAKYPRMGDLAFPFFEKEVYGGGISASCSLAHCIYILDFFFRFGVSDSNSKTWWPRMGRSKMITKSLF